MNERSIIIQELQSLGTWRGKVLIEPLAGGITNQNFLVEDETGRYVARICKELPLLGIDRRNEAACLETAARLGIAPALVHRDEGLLISRYVASQTLTPASLHDLAMIRAIGKTLRKLHDGRDVVTGLVLYFCPFQTIRTYAQTAVALNARLSDDVDDLLDDARLLADRIGPFQPVLCHNDLLPANMITSAGRLWLVDWEYAGMGHPLFDLASVSANAGLSDDEEASLLESYRGEVDPRELDLIRVFKAASLLREALWAVIQTAISDLAFDYRGYADRHFEAYRRARRTTNIYT
jgi:thiamine kinase-like enzyme